MSNTFGDNIKITLFGESHGEAVGAVLDSVEAGTVIDEGFIEKQLLKRSPSSFADLATRRREKDNFRIISGVYGGRATGAPICILIENKDHDSTVYEKNGSVMRPSHADYTAHIKYRGFEDLRGGGHFSGRLTAPLTAAGAIALKKLREMNIEIVTHIKSCGDISDRDFGDIEKDKILLNEKIPAVLDDDFVEKLSEKIHIAAKNGDSIGGILETVITGLPAGTGEPWFDTLEGKIALSVFSVPAVKGIEFGDGFLFSGASGSQVNDSLRYDGNGNVFTVTNHNGGINGGISNGMPVIFRTVIKPTPSVSLPQDTIDIVKKENTKIQIEGRHDAAVFLRAPVIIDSAAALAVLDLLTENER